MALLNETVDKLQQEVCARKYNQEKDTLPWRKYDGDHQADRSHRLQSCHTPPHFVMAACLIPVNDTIAMITIVAARQILSVGEWEATGLERASTLASTAVVEREAGAAWEAA